MNTNFAIEKEKIQRKKIKDLAELSDFYVSVVLVPLMGRKRKEVAFLSDLEVF